MHNNDDRNITIFKENFVNILKMLRLEKGYSAYEVIKKLNIASPTYYKWENGKRLINVLDFKKIAEFYNVPMEAFWLDYKTLKSKSFEDIELIIKDKKSILVEEGTAEYEIITAFQKLTEYNKEKFLEKKEDIVAKILILFSTLL